MLVNAPLLLKRAELPLPGPWPACLPRKAFDGRLGTYAGHSCPHEVLCLGPGVNAGRFDVTCQSATAYSVTQKGLRYFPGNCVTF